MRISVVIPLFNKRNTIVAALESVMMQVYKPMEIIIVNDGSTDGSEKIVSSLINPLARLINQPNQGVSAARNRGILEAKGDWIAFLDADDLWLPDFLATILSLHRKYPDCSVLATSYLMQTRLGSRKEIVLNKMDIKDEGIINNYFQIAAYSNPPLWSSAVVVEKAIIQLVGGFPLGIYSGEDLLTWARLACASDIAYSRTPGAIYNINMPDCIDKRYDGPPEIDLVAEELIKLKDHCTKYSKSHFNKYIARWHKSRASIYIRLRGKRLNALKEILISIKYNPINYKIYLLVVLLILPDKQRKFFFDSRTSR